MSGGGGGEAVALSRLQDLGDTYQHADDYDDDEIEDNMTTVLGSPMLIVDTDGDGVGDFVTTAATRPTGTSLIDQMSLEMPVMMTSMATTCSTMSIIA